METRVSQDLEVQICPNGILTELQQKPYKVVSKGKKKKTEFVDITATFDIETTNTSEDGFAYTFQMCIDGVCCLVRYFEDFVEILNGLVSHYQLSENRVLDIFIHNLGYEHWYITQLLCSEWGVPDNMLFTKPHKPLTISFPNGIRLRDSLKLFQKSLAGATKGCKHAKLVGDLDYSVYRTPDTPLTQQEFDYCINDVQGLYEAIERLKQDYKYNAATLPLTNTARVIDAVNKKIRASKNGKALDAMKKLHLDKYQLRLAYKCMAGGDTHGTRWRAGNTYYKCNSYDLKSAHPSQMLLWDFPSGKPVTMPENLAEKAMDKIIKAGMGWYGKVFVKNFRIKDECPNPTVSYSKCDAIVGLVEKDNGRVLGARGAFIYMDSNDWWRFKQAYTYEFACLKESVSFRLAPLPDAFRNAVFDFFKVKESADEGAERAFAKICVNTIFGACAQKTVRDEYDIRITDLIECIKTTWEDNLDLKSEEDVADSQESKFPFLWGMWTASLSRRCLFNLQKAVGWDRLIYWDTDSCKYEGEKLPSVERYNETIRDQCRRRGVVCQNKKGQDVYIGVAEDEYPSVPYGYMKFTFLHAKCYAALRYNKHTASYEVETTIAGVGKAQGAEALKGHVSRLRGGLFIENAGGQNLEYRLEQVRVRNDFLRPTKTASFIIMTPRQYLVTDSREDEVAEMDMEIISE